MLIKAAKRWGGVNFTKTELNCPDKLREKLGTKEKFQNTQEVKVNEASYLAILFTGNFGLDQLQLGKANIANTSVLQLFLRIPFSYTKS